MISHDLSPSNAAFTRLTERVRSWEVFYPFVPLVAFGLVLMLTAYVLHGLNHRAGNPSNPIDYQSTPIHDLPLWLSVTPIDQDIVVTTSKGLVFRWPQELKDTRALSPFIEDLRYNSTLEVKSAALLNYSYPLQGTVIISADRHLTFAHLRPIVFALAEAGISHYAIETKLTQVGDM